MRMFNVMTQLNTGSNRQLHHALQDSGAVQLYDNAWCLESPMKPWVLDKKFRMALGPNDCMAMIELQDGFYCSAVGGRMDGMMWLAGRKATAR